MVMRIYNGIQRMLYTGSMSCMCIYIYVQIYIYIYIYITLIRISVYLIATHLYQPARLHLKP